MKLSEGQKRWWVPQHRLGMKGVTFFSAFTLAFALSVGSFVYQAVQPSPAWGVAFERSFFQSVAVLLAWIMWRQPAEKVCRRGQGAGFCD